MHPYKSLDPRAFWAAAVAQRDPQDIDQIWRPKFPVAPTDKVVTFGSCFAQHIGRALRSRGFNWLNVEPAPPTLDERLRRLYNFGVFSARTGNIYTVSLLNQWIDWAMGASPVPEEIWTSHGRFFDPFRPNIEPNGFASAQELVASRAAAVRAFRRCILTSDVFVFTLGLTESWFNAEHGYEYPMCPGTVAGMFDPGRHVFLNQEYPFVRRSLDEAIRKLREANPGMRILLTVSPVPLTATMSGNHVLTATSESKAILRAVAGSASRCVDAVDYFPSYELISSTPFRGMFYDPNQRTVSKAGVAHVMSSFFRSLTAQSQGADGGQPDPMDGLEVAHARYESDSKDDVVCEELLLATFGQPDRVGA